MFKSSEEIARYPVTQEYLAFAVSGKIPPENVFVPIDICREGIFLSINKMVAEIGWKFSNNEHDVGELSSEAFDKIFRALKRFDPNKSKFTTWSYWVALNLIKSRMEKKNRRGRVVSEMPTGDDGEDMVEATVGHSMGITRDLHDALEHIKSRSNKTGVRIVDHIFGYDPATDSYNIPEKPNFAETARKTGIRSSIIGTFFKKEIMPVLSSRFDMGKDER